MKRNLTCMAVAATASVLGFQSCTKNAEVEKPNVLYIFPDQYRMQALGIWSNPEFRDAISTLGDPVKTPNIDRLAKRGVTFTQATSTHPVSSPHRAMLMSGMYPYQNGIAELNCKLDREQELKHEIECLTDVFAKGGYETAYVGKVHWHKTERIFNKEGDFVGTLDGEGGFSPNPFDTYVPEGKSRHSVKFWYQQLNDSHFNTMVYSNQPQYIEGKSDGEIYRPHRFSTTVEADVILDYLDNKEGKLRDAEKPFMLIWSINPPHNPYYTLEDCDEEIFNKYYRDMPVEELLRRANYIEGAHNQHTSYKDKEAIELWTRVYFSLITGVDQEIGRVLDKLDAMDETDNTLIVFTADHGEMMGSHALNGKNYIYDESFLVPFIVSYPNVIKKPRTTDLLIGSPDIMPTLLSMAGLGDLIPATVMGTDYSQGLLYEDWSVQAKPKSALYMRADLRGVRTNRYTYCVNNKGGYVLYDNVNDPYQLKEISLENIPSNEVSLLQSELGDWLNKTNDPWTTEQFNKELIKY